jgi:O-antigen/teichoic acid export membrane protein
MSVTSWRFRGGLARNTGSMLFSHGGRVLLQAAFFVLLARALGASSFGAFSGVVALVAILQPFGSLGTVILLIMHVSVEPLRASRQFSTSLIVTATFGLLVGCSITSLAQWVAPAGVTAGIAAAICGADLLGARLVDVASAVYQAQERMFRAAAYTVVLYSARLAFALALVAVRPHAGLAAWGLMYLVASVVTVVIVVVATFRDIGLAAPDLHGYRKEAGLGLQFAVSLTAQSVYNDIDKAMLARLGSLTAAGLYAAAYRVVDMAFIPMRALLAASYSRFFRHGTQGLGATVAFTRRIAVPGVAYCISVSGLLFVVAPVVPRVLGASFDGSVPVLRWLAVLPLFKACHYLAADALTGARMQNVRTSLQVGVALLNVGLNFWLIPSYSWHGAVYASLASDGGLALLLWFAVARQLTRNTAKTPVGALDAR